jgi:pimeloyl-ACP methyl ester carboxylesterase
MESRQIIPWNSIYLLGAFLWLAMVPAALAQESKGITLKTKDGVKLAITYYPSVSKEHALPVVILHDQQDSRVAYDSIARKLQQPQGEDGESFAVVTVDLRGHGGSTNQQLRNGTTRELDVAKLKKSDFEAMVGYDMEAVRTFLRDKNDQGEINLNELSIIGVGLGASVATIWASRDWAVPPLTVGKQGQDVKALVLVSPRWKNKGLLIQQAIRQPGVQRKIALIIIYGRDDSKVRADVRRIKKQVEKYHPEPESSDDKSRDLVGLGVPTSLQGDKLLQEVSFSDKIVQRISDFLNLHVAQENHEWLKRRNRIP